MLIKNHKDSKVLLFIIIRLIIMYKFSIRLHMAIIFIGDKSAYYFVRVKQNSVDEITSMVSLCTYLTIYVKVNLQNINFCLIS